MRIIRKYKDEDKWEEISENDRLNYTIDHHSLEEYIESHGYWEKGTVLKTLEAGELVFTPFAIFKKAEA